jgi:hypothetical protein
VPGQHGSLRLAELLGEVDRHAASVGVGGTRKREPT